MTRLSLGIGSILVAASSAFLFAGGEACKQASQTAACTAEKSTLVSTNGEACSTAQTAAKSGCCTGDKATLVSTDSASTAFESLKGLVGRWEGKPNEHGTPAVEFKLTANGTAVMETMFPGSPHEMTNIYVVDGDRILMTHYCASGNQPRMQLTQQDGNTMKFEFLDATNLPSDKAMYMNGLTMTIDGDKLTEKWTSMEGGKQSGEHAQFELTRASK